MSTKQNNVEVVNTRSTNRINNVVSLPKRIRLKDGVQHREWNFDRYMDSEYYASYKNANNKVLFTISKKHPREVSLDELYYKKARNKRVDAPATAILQTLRRMAPQVTLSDCSFVSHNCKLPRSFLPGEYNIYDGAKPTYETFNNLKPYRRITQALLSKSESMTPEQVLHELRNMKKMAGKDLRTMAKTISNATRKGGLNLKETHKVLECTYGSCGEFLKGRTFTYDPEDRLEIINTRKAERLDHVWKQGAPKRIQLQDSREGKSWNFDRKGGTDKDYVRYEGAEGKVKFNVLTRAPVRIIIKNLYKRQPKNKNVDPPVSAILQALRRLAPVVDVDDHQSYVSHGLQLPRAFLPKQYNLFHGATPTYENLKNLEPHRRLTHALLSNSESLSQNDVLFELKKMKDLRVTNENALVKMAKTISDASKKKGGLNLENTLHVLHSTFHPAYMTAPMKRRSFEYAPGKGKPG